MNATLPTLFVSHGATIFTSSATDPTHAWLASLAPRITRANPRAIVVVSAHHVTSGEWAVTSSAQPRLLHDHPVSERYGERYPAPGDPALAARIVAELRASGLAARVDPERGLDHGAWLPLRAMVPRADIPIVLLSLDARASFEQSISAGKALLALRQDRVLVLASGGVTHNQGEFRRGFLRGADPARGAPEWSVGFDGWVAQTLAMTDQRARLETLAAHTHRDEYLRAHPTPEHFWPLLVAAGAAGADAGVKVHAGFQHGLSMSAFLFGELAA
jgi:4,5-DOPA dioxygenase extradiol